MARGRTRTCFPFIPRRPRGLNFSFFDGPCLPQYPPASASRGHPTFLHFCWSAIFVTSPRLPFSWGSRPCQPAPLSVGEPTRRKVVPFPHRSQRTPENCNIVNASNSSPTGHSTTWTFLHPSQTNSHTTFSIVARLPPWAHLSRQAKSFGPPSSARKIPSASSRSRCSFSVCALARLCRLRAARCRSEHALVCRPRSAVPQIGQAGGGISPGGLSGYGSPEIAPGEPTTTGATAARSDFSCGGGYGDMIRHGLGLLGRLCGRSGIGHGCP